jgi:hypothetical protein
MDSCVSLLNSLKNAIIVVRDEIKALERINALNTKILPAYDYSITILQNSINNLTDVFVKEVPEQHALRLGFIFILKTHIDEFTEALAECKKWSENMNQPGACCIWFRLTALAKANPIAMEEKLKNAFKEIEPLIEKLIKLEEDILGSAKRIPHPILKKAWMRAMGGNQLKDGSMPSMVLSQSLYGLLKEEENNHLTKEDYCKEMIQSFVKYLDSLAGTDPDNIITLEEMKQYHTTEENSSSVKALLRIVKQPEDEVLVEIPIEFKSPFKINHSNERVISTPSLLQCYGGDFPNDKACEFVVPEASAEIKEKNLQLFGIEVDCKAIDQGWGGTGHAHVRYQVNDEEIIMKGFDIWRDKVPDSKYKFNIGQEQVKAGDTIKIWAFCPAWAGWSLTINNINVKARYA